ncbi:MAG: hypothetical protein ABL920_07165 [Methylotenera sp.]
MNKNNASEVNLNVPQMDSGALNFEDVHALELANIRKLNSSDPNTNKPNSNQANAPQTGLAFSGGGIRSATFNLGILQALAELKLLREFDYLSCVSGGGYIGGWLSAFIHRECDGKVEVAEEKLQTSGQGLSASTNEHPAIKFLRSYSNFLTPRASLFSADTLAAVATFLRNLYLNLTLLLLTLGGVLLLPRLLVWLVDWLASKGGITLASHYYLPFIFVIGGICAAIAMAFIGINLGSRGIFKAPPFYTRQGGILVCIVLPAVLSAWLIAYSFFAHPVTSKVLWLGGAFLYVLPWIVGWALGRWLSRHDTTQQHFESARLIRMAIFAVLAAAIGGALLTGFAKFAVFLQTQGYLGAWVMAGLGTALLLKVYSLTVVAHIGLMGRYFSHESREWLSRLGGWVLLISLVWAAIFTIVFIAPAFFRWMPNWFLNSGGLAWLAATAWGVMQGHSASSNGKTNPKWYDLITLLTPYIFVVGLIGLLSFGMHQLLMVGCDICTQPLTGSFMATLVREANNFQSISIQHIAVIFFGALFLAAALSYRIDINIFSIYHFYRQRLVRCYLGATRCKSRTPDVFTGFDTGDDLHLTDLKFPVNSENNAEQFQRPFPIHNTAMNLVGGKQLAWQQRRAASFAITPLCCGYSFTLPDEQGQRISHYRPSNQYMENVWLGSAVAISGAAASPNMGFHSSPALTFLMTVFNVRLGHWSGNPNNNNTWPRQGPRFAGLYLLKELFGLTDYKSAYVYLSDGGHFENLGIYELVRRRCATIVAIDAVQDAQSMFDDLGNAIRKCYADFSVVIDIHTDALKTNYAAVGRIQYTDGTIGTLIYIKPKITAAEPADLQSYALTYPGFPHQSTADQWFDEAQFESYRKLGHRIGLAAFETSSIEAQQRMKGEVGLPDIVEIMRENANDAMPK